MTGSINHTCCHLVVHILVRTWTLFLHLIGTFILCTTPETVVVFPTQILQNAVQAFRGLVTGYQPMPTNEKKKKKRRAAYGKMRSGDQVRGRSCALTFKRRNCAACSIIFGGKCNSVFKSAFFGAAAALLSSSSSSSPSSSG